MQMFKTNTSHSFFFLTTVQIKLVKYIFLYVPSLLGILSIFHIFAFTAKNRNQLQMSIQCHKISQMHDLDLS